MATRRIYTIGYGTRSTAEVIDQLKGAAIEFVVDVRSAPYSRHQPEFSREALERLLTQHKLRYVFMGDQLGGRPQDDDCYTDGRVDYSKCRDKDSFKSGFARLLDACDQELRVCILCSEGEPRRCHRAKLLGVVLEEHGIDVQHLLPNGGVASQVDVVRELTGGQESLFGDHFLSRQAYR